MPGTYDTATNTFRQAPATSGPAGGGKTKPLPLPRRVNRKPFPNFAGALAPARPYVRDPDASMGSTPNNVQYPTGVSNGKY